MARSSQGLPTFDFFLDLGLLASRLLVSMHRQNAFLGILNLSDAYEAQVLWLDNCDWNGFQAFRKITAVTFPLNILATNPIVAWIKNRTPFHAFDASNHRLLRLVSMLVPKEVVDGD